MGKLDDMLCVVTGGARGIGKAICAAYLAEGARVVLTDIDEDEGRKAAAGLGCSFHRLDVASETEWDALAAAFPAI
ncbi:SDR family NAD(P)-dependent oxidoreductase, partial [Erythrobacter sp. HI0077]